MNKVKRAKNQATKELRQKLKLEVAFSKEIRSLFKRMRDDLRVSIAGNMRVNANKYEPEWVSLLEKHYNRVQKSFTNNVQEFVSESKGWQFKQEEEEAIDADLLALALLAYRDQRAPEQAEVISNTNQLDMDNSISQARREIAEQEMSPDNRTLALVAATFLARKFRGRVGGISTLETQAPAEATKLIEAQLLSGRTPEILPNQPATLDQRPVTDATKQWITVGDNVVRPTHNDVNRSTIDIDDTFIVGGFRMRHPGDSSLGAPIREIAGCRCSLIYSV